MIGPRWVPLLPRVVYYGETFAASTQPDRAPVTQQDLATPMGKGQGLGEEVVLQTTASPQSVNGLQQETPRNREWLETFMAIFQNHFTSIKSNFKKSELVLCASLLFFHSIFKYSIPLYSMLWFRPLGHLAGRILLKEDRNTLYLLSKEKR